MIIIYNPKTGSKIEEFIMGDIGKIEPHDMGEMKQYPESVGYELLKIFGFLQEVTPKEAEQIVLNAKKIKCDFCEFTFDSEIVKQGHMKSHEKETLEEKEPILDPALVPIMKATPVEPLKAPTAINPIPQPPELSGPEWYGEGLTEERSPRPKIPVFKQG